MVEISCFYIHYNNNPINFTFIKYDKFMKIIFQSKMIVIAIQNLKKYEMLFKFYILSLLCTDDTSKICRVCDDTQTEIYGVLTQPYWKNKYLSDYSDIIILRKNCTRDPLLSQEPKKETSIKKQKKLLKIFQMYYEMMFIRNPIDYINDYQLVMIDKLNMDDIIEYEKKNLSSLMEVQ